MNRYQYDILLSFYKDELNGIHDTAALKSALLDATLKMDGEYVSGKYNAGTRKYIGELKELLYR